MEKEKFVEEKEEDFKFQRENIKNLENKLYNEIEIYDMISEILDILVLDLEKYIKEKKSRNFSPNSYIIYGENFGIENIKEWGIIDKENNRKYSLSDNWDNDKTISSINEKFDFVFDFLHNNRGMGTVYGLYSYIQALSNGINALKLRLEKQEKLKNIIEEYL